MDAPQKHYEIVMINAMAFLIFLIPALAISVSNFPDALVIPPRLVVKKNQKDVTIRLTPLVAQVHAGASAATPMWGYNGTSPGPTVEVEKGQTVRIHWRNELPTTHLIAAPIGMMNTGPLRGERVVMNGPRSGPMHHMPGMGDEPGNLPEVRNVTHLHGAAVRQHSVMDPFRNNDGWPDAWTVPGEEQVAEYPNNQDARTLWYHDHAIGETGRNVAAGLVGMYIIHDAYERSLNLPSGKYEVPLILQSLGVKSDGSLYYTKEIWNEFYGNVVAVNGKVRPHLVVEPRKYRFRILNASNSRSYGLKLVDYVNAGEATPLLTQIGTDAGLLENAADMRMLILAPAERADVIIDFSKHAGKQLLLYNAGRLTDPEEELPIPLIMLFKVGKKASKPDTSSLPRKMRAIPPLKPEQAAQTRKIEISEMVHADGSSMFQLDRRAWYYKKMDGQGDYWDYEIDVKPVLGTTEVWELVNTTRMVHPFHIHLVQFQILDRRPFDLEHYNETGEVVYTGDAEPPEANEAGWKDVARSNPGEITRLIMRFGPYPGYFVYHCHLLEHEDMDMMVPFQVINPKSQGK